MRLIKIPPQLDLHELLMSQPDFFLKAASSTEFNAAMRHANNRYFHWDNFRHRPLPDGFGLQQSWAYLKFLRRVNKKTAPFSDKNGAPFSLSLPESVQKTLNEIDRWSGDVIGTHGPQLPSRERYVISSLMEEAIASSQLEGAATTRDIAKEMLRSGRKPNDEHEQMIVNNWLSLQHLRALKTTPLTPQLVCDIHARITNKTMKDAGESGRIRIRDDVVVTWRDEVVHQPPKAALLEGRLEAFCRFANHDDDDPWLHPVVKAAMLHFWLAYDHPFTDGNGRTARALVYWYLLSRGYWLFEYLAISRYFLRAPGQYARAYLYTETDEGDLTYFIVHHLRVIHLAFRDLRLYLERKTRELAASSETLQHCPNLNLRQRNLIAHALAHPEHRYTIETHRTTNGIVYQTARQDLLDLAQKELLHQQKQGKAFVFVPSSQLAQRLQDLQENKR